MLAQQFSIKLSKLFSPSFEQEQIFHYLACNNEIVISFVEENSCLVDET